MVAGCTTPGDPLPSGDAGRSQGSLAFGAVDESGVAYLVRPVAPSDVPALEELRRSLGESGTTGSALAIGELVPGATPATELRREGSLMLVAGRAGTMVGAARYLQIGGSTEATVALAITDVPGHREIASRLVGQLALAAHERGIEHFVADLLPTNSSMLAVFVRAGFATEIGVGDGIMHMSFSVDPEGRDAGRSTVRAVPIWETELGSRHAELGADERDGGGRPGPLRSSKA